MTPRTHRLLLLGASLALAAIAPLIVFSTAGTGDYVVGAPVAGDNAGPALAAITRGHLAALVNHQPLMGLVSLVLRAPFVLITSATGADDLLTYRVGAFVCLLPLAIAGAWLISAPGPRPAERLPSIVGVLLILGGPALAGAVSVGHPEEVLAITLATAGVLAALSDRPVAAAVLLGLAVGTKPWALLAAGPVLAATPVSHRARTLTAAALVALPSVVLLPLADPTAFLLAGNDVGRTHLVAPTSLWWPLSAPLTAGSDHILPLGLDRSVASLAALAVALLAAAIAARRTLRGCRQLDPLALLALLGLIRCAVDPVTLEYNLVAVLAPLAAWEVLERGRLPVVTAASTVIASLLYGARLHVAPAMTNALSVAFVLLLGGYLARHAFHRRIRSLVGSSVLPSQSMPSLAPGVPA